MFRRRAAHKLGLLCSVAARRDATSAVPTPLRRNTRYPSSRNESGYRPLKAQDGTSLMEDSENTVHFLRPRSISPACGSRAARRAPNHDALNPGGFTATPVGSAPPRRLTLRICEPDGYGKGAASLRPTSTVSTCVSSGVNAKATASDARSTGSCTRDCQAARSSADHTYRLWSRSRFRDP